ncbi:MAG TPA: ABC transporter substrate-binding protein, partial [Nitrososphaerales archaeon]|nr:ABC transporter substrate-binding protein [Nitrososphaerales archaeon]
MLRTSRKKGISRVAIAVVIIVVIIIAAAAVVLARGTTSATTATTSSLPTTSSSSQSISSSTSSTPSSSTSGVSSTTSSSTSTSSIQSTTTSSTSTATQNQTLTIDDPSYPNVGVSTINPSGNYPVWTEGAVYQTLINFNLNAEQRQGVFELVPDLATNWTVSSNGETYTFQLRQGVTFSDGAAFNAYVVWANFYLYYYELGNDSSFWSYLPLFNFSSVVFGPATLNMINSSGLSSPSPQLLSLMSNSSWPAYVNGSSTIVFQLMGPYSFFLNSFPNFSMQTDPMFLLANGGPGNVTNPNLLFQTTAIPGTGPYVVTSVQTNAYIEFKQNPTYWGKNLSASEIAANPIIDPGHFQTVLVRYVPDDTSRYIDLLNGQSQISV